MIIINASTNRVLYDGFIYNTPNVSFIREVDRDISLNGTIAEVIRYTHMTISFGVLMNANAFYNVITTTSGVRLEMTSEELTRFGIPPRKNNRRFVVENTSVSQSRITDFRQDGITKVSGTIYTINFRETT